VSAAEALIAGLTRHAEAAQRAFDATGYVEHLGHAKAYLRAVALIQQASPHEGAGAVEVLDEHTGAAAISAHQVAPAETAQVSEHPLPDLGAPAAQVLDDRETPVVELDRDHPAPVVQFDHNASFHAACPPVDILREAAPDLLVAAQDALRCFISSGHEYYREVDTLRAAIAKATGSTA